MIPGFSLALTNATASRLLQTTNCPEATAEFAIGHQDCRVNWRLFFIFKKYLQYYNPESCY
jgi:hypothetical protein